VTPTLRPAQHRARAAFVAAIVVLCQAAAWVHAAAIPHVTCVEHGESVHLPAQGKAAPLEGVATAATPDDDATAHAHEHCNLQGHRTTQAKAPELGDADASFVAAAAPPAEAAHQAVRLLHLAPKTSPPRTPVV
jgi:hypothetical protein